MSKFTDEIHATIHAHLKPLIGGLQNPEVLTVLSVTGNSGSAEAKQGAVSIKSQIPLRVGMRVVCVPISAKVFHVVGYI